MSDVGHVAGRNPASDEFGERGEYGALGRARRRRNLYPHAATRTVEGEEVGERPADVDPGTHHALLSRGRNATLRRGRQRAEPSAVLGLEIPLAKARYAFPGASMLVLALLGGCAAHDALGPGSTAPALAGRAPNAAHTRVSTRDASGGKIQHVVYIIQENRSFNYMFLGFPGATTQDYGYDQNGNKIKLHKQTIATAWDIDHSADAFFAAYDNGKLDGWNSEYACCGGIPKNFAYAYAPKKETATYWQMAAQYVLADQFFQSNLDGSFIAHQYSIAAYANHEVDYPTSWWGCEGGRRTRSRP